VFRPSQAACLALILAASACGRVNYDPIAQTGAELDAGNSIDADPASTNCTAVARTGSYVGDGTNGRVIAAGVPPALVIIQSDGAEEAVMRMASMPINSSKPMVGPQAMGTGMISHTANGFAVGSDARVNQSGLTYHWLAIPASAEVASGMYTGNGSGQAITGLGFSPEWILFADEADGVTVIRTPQPAAFTFRLDDGSGVPDGVSSLDADGFTLGTRPFVNSNGRSFHYVAWRSSPGSATTGTYLGDGSADQIVSGLGLTPSYLMTHSRDRPLMHRFDSLPAFVSLSVIARAPIADTITGFLADAFSLGASANVNETGTSYTYSAFAACPFP
jgi:hypothetical protein